ncbi:MAG: hypothetical protein IT371_06790 [Deltaproteobacteria bacterium]|nr:hypothetical protein [Deltaproteobacteria bacterium]
MLRAGLMGMVLAAAMMLTGFGTAHATGRLSNNPQRTAKAAALKGAAFYLNHFALGGDLRDYFGRSIGSKQLWSVKVLSTSATGVQRWLVATRKQIKMQGGEKAALATVKVSVKQLPNGKWSAYTGGSGNGNMTLIVPMSELVNSL